MSNSKSDELQMLVSPICVKDGRKVAYVTFSDEQRTADGIIPDCEIVKNSGFAEWELAALKEYMKENLAMLKRMSSGVGVMKAFRGES